MLISIVMPAWNAEKYLQDAIESVLAQTHKEWELLVVDDGSVDGTCDIVEKIAAEDGRVHLIRNGENRGVAYARNVGLAQARGEYVALLDSDDIWYPEKLEKQLALAQRTKADVVYCGYSMIDGRGRSRWADFHVPEQTDYDSFLTRSVISCSTALLSRRVVETYRFDGNYDHEDFVLWLQLLRDGCLAVGVPEILASYRVTYGSRSWQKWRTAVGRWTVYRQFCGYSRGVSAKLLVQYGLAGFQKYSQMGGKSDA